MGRFAGIMLRKADAKIGSMANVTLRGIGNTSKNVGVVHGILVFSLVAKLALFVFTLYE